MLEERAAEAVPQPDLLQLVGDGVRRDRRRRTALAGGAAALALAAIVAVPVALSGARKEPSQPPATAPAATWAPPSWPQPVFPLTPGWLPPGIGKPVVTQMGPNTVLKYEKDTDVLAAEVGPLPGSWDAEGEEDHAGAVNGRPATVRTAGTFDGAKEGERYVGIRWQLADGRWAQLVSFGRRDEAQVLRFANGLRPGGIAAGKAPFSIALVPPGFTLQFQGADTMCLTPGAAKPTEDVDVRQPAGLCLMVVEETFDEAGLASSRVVGGRRIGWWTGTQLHVDLGAGRALEVSGDLAELPLTDEDVIRFAAGVGVNP